MSKDTPSVSPAACSLERQDAAERKRRFDELCAEALLDCTPTETGLSLRFRQRVPVEQELRELARLEAACCAFAQFTVARLDEAVELRVSAPAEALDTVRRLFSPSPEASRVSSRTAAEARPGGSVSETGGDDPIRHVSL